MASGRASLLGGRNVTPLSPEEVRRVSNTFLGLERSVNARYDPASRTAFHVAHDESGGEYGEIVFGADIYPGVSVADPNSFLSLDAAAAHELTHFHRWKDKTALAVDRLEHLDEALTSLNAIFRYGWQLNDTDMRQLVADAIQRLQLFIQEQ